MKPEKKPRGAPAHQPTIDDRLTVERMRALGDPLATIARAVRVTIPTLEKHYANELENGAANQRREIVQMVFDGALKGNASLVRRLEEMTRISGALAGFEDQVPKVPKLGKKEIVRQGALTAGAGNEWGDDLKPPPDSLPN